MSFIGFLMNRDSRSIAVSEKIVSIFHKFYSFLREEGGLELEQSTVALHCNFIALKKLRVHHGTTALNVDLDSNAILMRCFNY